MTMPQLTLDDIKAERKVIRREFKKLTERIAALVERNDELDALERELMGEHEVEQ